MSSDTFLNDKDLKRLDREIQALIDKSGLDRKTEDEVFDKSTLRVLEKMISDGIIDILDFPISTGKEGNIFRGITPDKKFVALKIYRTSTSTFKHLSKYIIGDPRFNSIQTSRRGIIFAWTKKEFKNLERLKSAKVSAPKPILFTKNVLVMEYIGSKKRPAPLLKDIKITNPEKMFKQIIQFISKMYKQAGLVHSDLSAFNILIHKNEPYIIDLGQGVLLEHPNSIDFLKRDIHNIVSYFNKFNIRADEEKIFDSIVKNSW